MPAKAATAVTALLLVFGAVPGALADMPNQRDLFSEHSVPLVSHAAPNQEAVVASQFDLLQRAFYCRAAASRAELSG
jgi:hypothetical protein